jgi:hypothetical protein
MENTSICPTILQAQPEPKLRQVKFHGRTLAVFEGKSKIGAIHGWVKNPRIDMEVTIFKDSHAGRDPDDDEIFAIMKSIQEFKLKDLAADIRVNGVRQPIIISHGGDLIDGNRRYFATKLILEGMKDADPGRAEFENVPVWVLDGECTNEDIESIIVQENFYPALKVEWPDYIKAKHIYEDLKNGIPAKTISQKYHWKSSKIEETRKIMELIDEFIEFATSDGDEEEPGLGISTLEAEKVAAVNYQYFNEATKSFRSKLQNDFEFKIQFFRWIYDRIFSSFQEVRICADAWENEQAKKILLSDDPKAAKKAKAVIDYEKSGVKKFEKAEQTIHDFIRFLENMTTQDKSALDEGTLVKLKDTLKLVVKMAESTKD